MLQKKVEEMLKEVALKWDKPLHVVEEVFMSQFKLTRKSISSLNFEVIKLPALGKFIPSDNKVINLKEYLLTSKYQKYGKAEPRVPTDNQDTSI